MIPGIFWAAMLTSVFSLLIWGQLLNTMPGKVSSRVLLTAFLVALPLQPAAYYLVRMLQPLADRRVGSPALALDRHFLRSRHRGAG